MCLTFQALKYFVKAYIFIAKIKVIFGNFENNGLDLLLPYSFDTSSTVEKHTVIVRAAKKSVANCQPHHFGNATYSLLSSHHNANFYQAPLHLVQSFTVPVQSQRSQAFGHLVWLNNPSHSVHLLEPGGSSGGCMQHKRATVFETSYNAHKTSGHKCIAAINAGFFNTHNGACLGNVVVDDILKRDDRGIKNVHFGITFMDELFFGYLTEDMLLRGPWPASMKMKGSPWRLLVGGVIWLVHDGINHVTSSLSAECADTEESGTLFRFATLRSARTAVAVDRDGRLIFVQVNGETDHAGMNLFELADFLISLGVLEAVNLDGGGSSTLLLNDTLISQPSDYCSNKQSSDTRMRCARQVSTVLCARSSTPDSTATNRFNWRFSHVIGGLITMAVILLASVVLNMWLCYLTARQHSTKCVSPSTPWTRSTQENDQADEANWSLLSSAYNFHDTETSTL